MPLPACLISASSFICESILREENKVLSAIRIIDVMWVPTPPSHLRPEQYPFVQAYALIMLKVHRGSEEEKHIIRLSLIKPSGEVAKLGDDFEANFHGRVEGAIPGQTIVAQLNIQPNSEKGLGVYYVCAFLDDVEITRSPLTLLQTPPESDSGFASDEQGSVLPPNR